MEISTAFGGVWWRQPLRTGQEKTFEWHLVVSELSKLILVNHQPIQLSDHSLFDTVSFVKMIALFYA